MRVAVISDIHANWHALEAVLSAVDAESPDEIWCLGDVVGYGPRPNRCCSAVAGRASVSLAGNHDLGVLGAIEIDAFSPDATAAAVWTRGVLAPEARAYLEALSPQAVAGDGEVDLFHASPRDPVWDYVLTGEGVLDALERTSAPLVLVGHSHVPIAVLLADRELTGGVAPEGTEADLSAGRWLLNPGSVGQPRDGDPRAAFLILDIETGRATFRRVEYPIEHTQAEMRDRGLPEALTERLADGV
jgi:diadenosine tetraphosphatase ApaH/serine/threonine PP2A family protein phosphatase